MPGTMLSVVHTLPQRQSELHFIGEKSDAKDLYQGHIAKICDKTKI